MHSTLSTAHAAATQRVCRHIGLYAHTRRAATAAGAGAGGCGAVDAIVLWLPVHDSRSQELTGDRHKQLFLNVSTTTSVSFFFSFLRARLFFRGTCYGVLFPTGELLTLSPGRMTHPHSSTASIAPFAPRPLRLKCRLWWCRSCVLAALRCALLFGRRCSMMAQRALTGCLSIARTCACTPWRLRAHWTCSTTTLMLCV